MHAAPVPRIGGLSIALCVTVTAWWVTTLRIDASLVAAVTAASVLALISLIDDRFGLPALLRLAAHAAAAVAVVSLITDNDTPAAIGAYSYAWGAIWCMVLATVGVVWMTNLYNFMDGANGMAGFMGLIGFGALALAATMPLDAARAHEFSNIALLCASTSGACGGFLVFNFPAGRVFMGDVGAVFLGFLAGSVGLLGAAQLVWPWWLPLLVFSPFVVDATVTLLRRAWCREKVWLAHREHTYQRLIVVCGWSHQRTAIVYATLMALTAAHGLVWLFYKSSEKNAADSAPPLSIALTWMLIYAALLAVAERQIRQQELTKTNMSAKEDQGAR